MIQQDIPMVEKCPHCGEHLVLRASKRQEDESMWLIQCCPNVLCGLYPAIELAPLGEEQIVKEKEIQYLIINYDDINRYLTPTTIDLLKEIVNAISNGREADGNGDCSFLVVNVDEPYAREVQEVILRGEQMKLFQQALEQSHNEVPDEYVTSNRYNFPECLEEFGGDLCTLCSVPDEESFDNDGDKCPYDEQKKESSCPGFSCVEQCRLCDPSCQCYNTEKPMKSGDTE
jgi:hypothetical protein